MAIEEMFTSLPTVSSATMNDIICAVQGYTSPSNLGLSVQENLGQIFSLFSTSMIVSYPGNPNGNVAGTQYQTLCWDTSDNILYICVTSGTASLAVWTKVITLTAGSGITIAQSGNTITISSAGGGLSWNNVTGTSATMVSGNGYVANNAGLVTLALPAASSFGDTIKVLGYGAGGWKISQATGQQIIMGNASTTLGATGSLASTNAHDSIELVCIVANTIWQISVGSQGSLTVV